MEGKALYEFVDVHAHREELADLDQALKRVGKAGVTLIITWALTAKRTDKP